MGSKKFELNEDVIQQIITAVQETFYQSLVEEIEFVSVCDAEDKSLEKVFDLQGIVCLEQDRDDFYSDGLFKCDFKKDSIFYILNKLYKKELNDIDRSSIHCAGEFTNIIYTRVKSNLNEQLGFSFKMAVPAVALHDKDMVFPYAKNESTHKVLTFKFRDQPFYVHLKVRHVDD